MAATTAERRMAVWAAVFCAWAAVLCLAAPPRWQQGTEATTDAWADEFDLDGDKEWLGDAPISPSSIPQQSDYEDYDDNEEDNEDANNRRQQSLDLEEDEEQPQDSEPHQSEFLFVPSRDNRLMLQDDDDDQNGPIKVRHTGKNTYPEVVDGDSSSDEDSNDSSHQFEFTIDNGDEDVDDNEVDDDTNDFVLDDAPRKDDKVHDDTTDDDEDDDDDNFVSDGDSNDDPMFETPEEDSQVIYGDHVFLY